MERWTVHFSVQIGQFPRSHSFFPSFDIWVRNEEEAVREIIRQVREVIKIAAMIRRKSVGFICWAHRVVKDVPERNEIVSDAYLHLLNKYSNKKILGPISGKKLFVRTSGDNRWLDESEGDI